MPLDSITFGNTHTYVLERVMNQTNYSTVYQAYDKTVRRAVCIKVIDLHVFDGVMPNALDYVERELKVMTSLADETIHIPCLLDSFYDAENRRYYIVMQLCKGTSFREVMGRIMPLVFLRYMVSLCQTLLIMHRKNLYHKDIKPENLLVTDAEELMVLDFNTTLSAPNLYEGTPGYQAPEMLYGNTSTERDRVDVFAIGIMLYEYFGRLLPKVNEDYYVSGDGWGAFIPPHEQPNALPLAKALSPIIMKCLAFKRKDRYDMVSLKRALEDCIRKLEHGKRTGL